MFQHTETMVPKQEEGMENTHTLCPHVDDIVAGALFQKLTLVSRLYSFEAYILIKSYHKREERKKGSNTRSSHHTRSPSFWAKPTKNLCLSWLKYIPLGLEWFTSWRWTWQTFGLVTKLVDHETTYWNCLPTDGEGLTRSVRLSPSKALSWGAVAGSTNPSCRFYRTAEAETDFHPHHKKSFNLLERFRKTHATKKAHWRL